MGLSHEVVQELYSRESHKLKSFLARKLGNLEDAEDVLQESYIRMMSAPIQGSQLRSDKAFLFAVASNLAVDSMRRKRRERVAFENGPHATVVPQGEHLEIVCPTRAPDLCVDDLTRIEDVIGSISKLPPKCRKAFLLHKFLELSYAEVASQLEVTVSMVEKYLSQALHYVRTQPFAPNCES
jgi:RNA polymerase sigma factor (sigma-70 family)